MTASELKVGDRIRITGVPGDGIPGYQIHAETVRVYKKLVARGRAVRIYEIDEYGAPWFACRFRTKNKKWEHHFLAVYDTDTNWVPVIRRRDRPSDKKSGI
ncbi:hypothetical protein J8F10_12230 [Gemmata sp. G18]|uniref:Uncharacterized protein n=1 Tax=Gemmata palustris TaxID=2822762 RepID=A0ABS5BQN9_9BACT|nr:hypothetical protein [Gemmata palustris]MBP3956050.1 hypothetical protein [Gemmata palustris]